MKQQRIRRNKSLFINEAPSKWNRNKITPGTEFMNNLSKSFYKHFNNSEKKYKVKKVIVSCTDKHGEGEQKIMEFLRNNSDINKTVTEYYFLWYLNFQ